MMPAARNSEKVIWTLIRNDDYRRVVIHLKRRRGQSRPGHSASGTAAAATAGAGATPTAQAAAAPSCNLR